MKRRWPALAAMLPAGTRAGRLAYPSDPADLPYGPGGSADQVARLYGG